MVKEVTKVASTEMTQASRLVFSLTRVEAASLRTIYDLREEPEVLAYQGCKWPVARHSGSSLRTLVPTKD